MALLLSGSDALAARPTTAQCLAASHTSLELEKNHHLRAERKQLLVCAAPSCPVDIRKDCLRQVDAVNARIPTIVFGAKDPSGADVAAVSVTMDDEPLADRLDGTPLAIDPGTHSFTFRMEGQAPVTKTFVIQEGQQDRREIVTFGTPVVVPVPIVVRAPVATPSTQASAGMGAQMILALVATGIGVAGIGTGTAFGVVALSRKNAAQSECPGQCATQDGVNKWNDVMAAGNVSTIGFVVGGVGLAAGVVLWLTAPSFGGSTQVGLGPGELRWRAVW